MTTEPIVRAVDNADLPQRIDPIGVHRPVWADVDCPSCGDAGGCGHPDVLCCHDCDDHWPCAVADVVADELDRLAGKLRYEEDLMLRTRARHLRGDAS